MDTPVVDFSFIYEMSDNDTAYVYEVVSLYLSTLPDNVKNLERLITETDDFEAIQKQAHFLKSSANVIKIRGMYENLVAIEMLARAKTGKEEMGPRLADILANFYEALPIMQAERDNNKPKEQ
jgi:HPt (histidine-containing phosphotransfer) domain-containing protein